jgi:FK506-binding protein 1
MGVTKEVLIEGNGTEYPKAGDEVTIEYTGNLYDKDVGSQNHFRGKQYAQLDLPSTFPPVSPK